MTHYRNMTAGILVLGIAVAGCKPSDPNEKNTAQPETATSSPAENSSTDEGADPREKVMLHARVDFTSSMSAPDAGTQNTTHIQLELRQPAFRSGKGSDASFDWDTDQSTEVRGDVDANGSAHISSDQGDLTENYQKSSHWPNWTVPEKGVFSIQMPEKSHVGEGLSVRVNIHAPVSGTQTARITSPQGSMETEASLSIPLACGGQNQYIADGSSGCGIEISMDPNVSSPQDAAGQVLFPQLKDALAAPNGETLMAMQGTLFGAQTEYREDGHFVVHMARDYPFAKEGSSIDHRYKVVVWSTRLNDDWVPEAAKPD